MLLSLRAVIFAFLLFSGTLQGPSDTYPRQEGIDIEHYAFELFLSDDTDLISGRATVIYRVLGAGTRDLALDLIGTAPDGETGMTVSSVSSGGRSLRFRHLRDRVLVDLPASSKGDLGEVVVEYSGVPAAGLVVGPNKYGDRTFFSDNWPNRARNWLPVIDHPYDKATSEFIVTAPDHYQVVSNGLLVEETDLEESLRLTHWKNSVPISPWLYNLGVAEFAVQHVGSFRGKPIQTWVYRQDRDAGFYDFAEPTEQVLTFFSDFIGPFAYEKLANIQSNSVGGGMEAASSIFYGDDSVTGTRSIRWRTVVIHEIAHQWFGNAVTESDWDDVWLSEGFATYFTLLFREAAYGRDDFVAGLKQARKRVFRYYQDHPGYRIVHDNLSDMSQVTSPQIYQKGAWILHMLRNRIGDDAFRRGIRSYYLRYMNSNATTADFAAAMEEASREDLSGFFSQWLYQGGNIVIDGSWKYDETTGKLSVSLRQVQDYPAEFIFPVEIGIYTGGAPTPAVRSLRFEGREDVTSSWTLSSLPDSVVLDPSTVLLADWTFVQEK